MIPVQEVRISELVLKRYVEESVKVEGEDEDDD
jgi:hypothetical protein